MLNGEISSQIRHTFKRQLYRIWRKSGKGRPLGLAISGGVDSMALAKLCADVTRRTPAIFADGLPDLPRIDTTFTGFIVDHKLRDGSKHEAEQVAAELRKLHIEPQILELDWHAAGLDPSHRVKLESSARTLRYQALGRACRDRGINTVLAAHHADDQAETVLCRIISGHVGSGLCGMSENAQLPECQGIYGVYLSGSTVHGSLTKPLHMELQGGVRTISVENGVGVRLARPLLGLNKQQLIEICQGGRVKWFEDHTNADPSLTVRNTVRHLHSSDLLPVALGRPRLLQIAALAEARAMEIDMSSREQLTKNSMILNSTTGVAKFVIQDLSLGLPQFGYAVLLTMVRNMLRLVSPLDSISRRALHQAVKYIFLPDDQSSAQDSALPSMQSAGVQILRSTSCNKEILITMHRAPPSLPERAKSRITLWSAEHLAASDIEPEWQLWDGRYWVRILPPADAAASPYRQISIRFLTEEDATRMHQFPIKRVREEFKRCLVSAKGLVRHTLPVIVASKEVGSTNNGTIEELVALPTLDWKRRNWVRGSKGSHDTLWRWDIKYKNVTINAEARKNS